MFRFKIIEKVYTSHGVDANGGFSRARDITITGYKPIAILGFSVTNMPGHPTSTEADASWCVVPRIWIGYDYTYDHAGRLLKTKYKINDKPEIVLNDMTESGAYDELGRLRKKKRHSGADSEEYDYNIRNWAERIKSGHRLTNNDYISILTAFNVSVDN